MSNPRTVARRALQGARTYLDRAEQAHKILSGSTDPDDIERLTTLRNALIDVRPEWAGIVTGPRNPLAFEAARVFSRIDALTADIADTLDRIERGAA